MDHRQRELRRAAARDFLESLHQLENTFTPHVPSPEPAQPTPPPPPEDDYLQELEDAAADIERFLQDLDDGDVPV